MNHSILRYPGSKYKIRKTIESVLKKNNLKLDLFVEPFVGGGSIFIYLLENKLVEKVIISDKDNLIYSFWKVLFKNPTVLIKFIKNVSVTTNSYIKYKNIASEPKRYNITTLAKTCLFLNRTSFSGIIAQTAGPIGGKKQISDYKIDCRFNKQALIKRIKEISKYSNKVTVLEKDWQTTTKFALSKIKKKRKSKSLFYFDPPFYFKSEKLYRVTFNENDHINLSKYLLRFKKNWLLSYDNAIFIKKLYKRKYRTIHITVPYTVNHKVKKKLKEIIITPLNI